MQESGVQFFSDGPSTGVDQMWAVVRKLSTRRFRRSSPTIFRFVVIDEAFSRGSEEATKYGLNLFKRLGLQLLIATPLLKIDVIEPFVAGVGLVVNKNQKDSSIKNVTIEEHLRTRAERRAGG